MTYRFPATSTFCAALALLLTPLPARAQVPVQGEFKDPVPGKIVYVRPQISSVPISPCRGKTYEDTVPDTYDVAERARLAINALTAATNAKADHEIFFRVYFNRNPVVMVNDFDDWCGLKYMEALPLLRVVTGSTLNDSVDRAWMDVVLKSIGPDGRYYIPFEGRPWGKNCASLGATGEGGVVRPDGTVTTYFDPTVKQFTHPFTCGKSIGIMTVYNLHDQNPIWKKNCQRMIDQLLRLAIHKEDYCYFPPLVYEPRASRPDPKSPRVAMPKAMLGGELNGRVIQPAARFYKLTGYEPARLLAEKLTRFMRFHDDYFAPNGEFLAEQHFHAHTLYLLGMLDCATAVEDKELLEFVRKSFVWAKSPTAGSSTLLGYFPEYARPGGTCESCEIADMIAMALKLSQAGAGDYYEDAERWTRNHFAESQLTQCDWVYHQAKKQPAKDVGPFETADRVAERNLGAFAGWSSANEWWSGQGLGIMNCCLGNAARTLYYIWQHALDYQEGRLTVHMLLNRASPWADIYSSIPYQGQVDLKIKQPCKSVLVHAPEWIENGSPQLVATVQGTPRAVRWDGRYVDLGAVEAGQTVQIKFPISERTVKETIGGVPYTLVVKGNTVVAIDPPGKTCPLYQRGHYRQEQVRFRTVTRFVSEDDLDY